MSAESIAAVRAGADTLSPHEPITLGMGFDGSPCALSLPHLMNFNIGLVGSSGSGKTTLLSYVTEQLCRRGITVVAIDTQGDQAGGSSGIDESMIERSVFRYGDASTQINPLQIHDDPDAGGPYAAIEDAIATVQLLKPSLGDMQIADLRWLLIGYIRKCGIELDEPSTWNDEQLGSWADFRDYIRDQLSSLRSGADAQFFTEFRKAVRIAHKVDSGRKVKLPEGWETYLGPDTAGSTNDISISDLREVVQSLADNAFEQRVGNDSPLDESERSPRRIGVLESVISNMVDSTLFDQNRLRIRPGRVNIFDLSNISQRHMMSLIHLLLKRVFTTAQRQTRRLNPSVPWLMVSLDESKLAVSTGKDQLSPINRIATEARKYGLGMLLGVQHLGHLNGEIMSSLGTKIVLPMDRDKYSETCRRLMINRAELDMLKPRSDGLVFLNKDGGVPVHLLRGV